MKEKAESREEHEIADTSMVQDDERYKLQRYRYIQADTQQMRRESRVRYKYTKR